MSELNKMYIFHKRLRIATDVCLLGCVIYALANGYYVEAILLGILLELRDISDKQGD